MVDFIGATVGGIVGFFVLCFLIYLCFRCICDDRTPHTVHSYNYGPTVYEQTPAYPNYGPPQPYIGGPQPYIGGPQPYIGGPTIITGPDPMLGFAAGMTAGYAVGSFGPHHCGTVDVVPTVHETIIHDHHVVDHSSYHHDSGANYDSGGGCHDSGGGDSGACYDSGGGGNDCYDSGGGDFYD